MSRKLLLNPNILFHQKIWDNAQHNAFPDLIRYKNQWLCALRESTKHADPGGKIRILQSADGLNWHSVAYLEEEGVDFRDPKLSITPEETLMLLAGGSYYSGKGKYLGCQSRVSFSKNGKEWTPFTLILEPHEWLWRVTWHKGIAYGASYRLSNPHNKKEEWIIKLFESQDGFNYHLITKWDILGYPNETTLRFLNSDEMVALVRRDKKKDNYSWIGRSSYPYRDWKWAATKHYFGGPNFLILPDDRMLAGGRLIYHDSHKVLEKTVLASMDFNDLKPLLILPSGGDCSYPSLVYYDDHLWMSYYSSHEGKAAIYLAKIQL